MPVTVGGEASWLVGLRGRVAAMLGRAVTSIKEVCREESGMRVCGTTLSDSGVPFAFSISGPFDVEVADPAAAPVPDPQMLHPFGTEFGPAIPVAQEFDDTGALWGWAAPQVPVVAQPRLNGFDGIIEKKGGEAKLWLKGNRGTDQLSKFPALKEYVLKLGADFVAEVNMGLERDQARLAQAEQETLAAESLQMQPQDRLALTLGDLMYFNGDVHEMDAAARYAKLAEFHRDSLAQDPAFRLMPMREARDESQLREAVEWARAYGGSDGAVIKAAGSPYVLNTADDKRAWASKFDAPPAMGIYKSMPEERIAIGVILRPNYQDAQADIMSPEEVRKAAHWYMENGQTIKLRHGKDPVQGDKPLQATVLESYIAPVDFPLGNGQVLKGDWVGAVRIDDQGVWDKIQSGEYQGFSVGGLGTRQEIQ